KVKNAAYNEIVKIKLKSGEFRLGQVLDTSETQAVVQVFGPTNGINVENSSVSFLGETFNVTVSDRMLGRIFDGQGRPKDNGPAISSGERRDINGEPINPVSRVYPSDFIQTGISTIDGLNTLARGKKLPIFSSSGLAHNQLTAQITRQAKVRGTKEGFAVVFAGIGITYDDAEYF
ncbi:MAG: V-type ATP synthase subunit B, partial [Candidatus Micrarchaeota archaeon]|nr:V-type ATP synthase subunit B [Candidatus Micrarchaeota archaeon]